eukprot:gnl/TRDRNA2_/TRDRNA2_41843_c0_seq1.p1 gnl/TRDRNA2_/TRDRNA2_41843_c0~~gnl/TRDRNA2_/TRDRNA2_41843_c0_seq1.p1  ORF type:complete len:293 (+),score=61.83 gnl/TRDRNA2_/TRDRNA2_41843_c0_seq1:85-963(+)
MRGWGSPVPEPPQSTGDPAKPAGSPAVAAKQRHGGRSHDNPKTPRSGKRALETPGSTSKSATETPRKRPEAGTKMVPVAAPASRNGADGQLCGLGIFNCSAVTSCGADDPISGFDEVAQRGAERYGYGDNLDLLLAEPADLPDSVLRHAQLQARKSRGSPNSMSALDGGWHEAEQQTSSEHKGRAPDINGRSHEGMSNGNGTMESMVERRMAELEAYLQHQNAALASELAEARHMIRNQEDLLRQVHDELARSHQSYEQTQELRRKATEEALAIETDIASMRKKEKACCSVQ